VARGDRVTEVDVEPEPDDSGRDAAVHRNADTRVERVLADRPRDRRVSEELDAIIGALAGNLGNPAEDGVLIVHETAGERVDIGRGAAGIVGREQHAALEHELLRVG
jgi:hypothetical protein